VGHHRRRRAREHPGQTADKVDGVGRDDQENDGPSGQGSGRRVSARARTGRRGGARGRGSRASDRRRRPTAGPSALRRPGRQLHAPRGPSVRSPRPRPRRGPTRRARQDRLAARRLGRARPSRRAHSARYSACVTGSARPRRPPDTARASRSAHHRINRNASGHRSPSWTPPTRLSLGRWGGSPTPGPPCPTAQLESCARSSLQNICSPHHPAGAISKRSGS
jgi:hypothetical protein